MADSPLIEDLAAIVRPVAKIPPGSPIGPDMSLVDDLGIDSLDLVGVVLKIQDHYDVMIDDDELPKLRRLSDLAAYVAAHRGPAAA